MEVGHPMEVGVPGQSVPCLVVVEKCQEYALGPVLIRLLNMAESSVPENL